MNLKPDGLAGFVMQHVTHLLEIVDSENIHLKNFALKKTSDYS